MNYIYNLLNTKNTGYQLLHPNNKIYYKEEIYQLITSNNFKSINFDKKDAEKIEVVSNGLPELLINLYKELNKIKKNEDIETKQIVKKKFYSPEFTLDDVLDENKQLIQEENYNYQLTELDIKKLKEYDQNIFTIKEFTDNLEANNSCDFYGYTKDMFVELPNYYKTQIVNYYNNYYDGKYDNRMNIGKTVFVYKEAKQGPLNKLNSFRPLVILPHGIKHFHKMLATKVNDFCEENNYFDKTIQKGGVRNVSYGVFEHIFKIKEVIKHSIKNEQKLSIMFLDIQNAYGNLKLDKLLSVMHKYHLPDKLCNYIENFYTSLDYYFMINKTTTGLIKWSKGIIQGCPLSPTFFNLVINYIINQICEKYINKGYTINNKRILFTAFVDDLCIVTEDTRGLEIVYCELEKLLKSFGLPVSKSKTKFIEINQDSKTFNDIEKVTHHLYLGVIISSNGENKVSYDEFIKNLESKLKEIDNLKTNDIEKNNVFEKTLLKWIEFKTKTLYDIKETEKNNINSMIYKFLLKWSNDKKYDLFNTIKPLLEMSTDEIINTFDIDELMKKYNYFYRKIDLKDVRRFFNLDYDSIHSGPKIKTNKKVKDQEQDDESDRESISSYSNEEYEQEENEIII